MYIFLNNLSEFAVNKILHVMMNTNNLNYTHIKGIFTNVNYNKNSVLNNMNLFYLENITDMYDFISNKKIKIFISNYIENDLFNKCKMICSFVSLTKVNNPEISFYKDLPSIIDKYITSNKIYV